MTPSEIGLNRIPSDPHNQEIVLPVDYCQFVSNVEELIEKVFPNVASNFRNHDWLHDRAILAPLNSSVYSINSAIQDKLPGYARTYNSVDTTVDPEQAVEYPVEFLNSLLPSSMPQHELTLKVGSTIILLRNVSPPKLVNGTRLVVKRLHSNLLEATILVGQYKGEVVFIPRIPLISDDTLLFQFKRLQFPVRLAFAMTINKSQGQSLGTVGLALTDSCFTHGQLYVACSRIGSPSGLFVLANGQRTKNIVFPSVLR